MKNSKTFCKAKTVNRLKEIIQLPLTHPRQTKSYYVFGTKIFLAEIYRNMQTFAFKVLQKCSSWASRNGAVQMFFLTSNRNMFAGKFVKSERLLFSMSSELSFPK